MLCKRFENAVHSIFNKERPVVRLNKIYQLCENPTVFTRIKARTNVRCHKHFSTILGNVNKKNRLDGKICNKQLRQ